MKKHILHALACTYSNLEFCKNTSFQCFTHLCWECWRHPQKQNLFPQIMFSILLLTASWPMFMNLEKLHEHFLALPHHTWPSSVVYPQQDWWAKLNALFRVACGERARVRHTFSDVPWLCLHWIPFCFYTSHNCKEAWCKTVYMFCRNGNAETNLPYSYYFRALACTLPEFWSVNHRYARTIALFHSVTNTSIPAQSVPHFIVLREMFSYRCNVLCIVHESFNRPAYTADGTQLTRLCILWGT